MIEPNPIRQRVRDLYSLLAVREISLLTVCNCLGMSFEDVKCDLDTYRIDADCLTLLEGCALTYERLLFS
jgi:hypothetical protein